MTTAGRRRKTQDDTHGKWEGAKGREAGGSREAAGGGQNGGKCEGENGWKCANGCEGADGENVRTDAKVRTGVNVRHGEKVKTGEKVKVNVDELAAESRQQPGFSHAGERLGRKGNLGRRRLEPLAERLKILVTRRDDLRVFRGLVPSGERSSVGRLESPRTAISGLGARIAEARTRASGEDFKGTEAERRTELSRLDALSHRLAELEEK